MLCSRFGSVEMCMRKFETAFFSSSWNSMKVKQRYCHILNPRSWPYGLALQPQWGLTSYPFSLSPSTLIRTFPLPLNDPASLA